MGKYTRNRLINDAKLTDIEVQMLGQLHEKSRVGFAYQLAYVKLENTFLPHGSLEEDPDLIDFLAVQLGLSGTDLEDYLKKRKTIRAHQKIIQKHLGLHSFDENSEYKLTQYIKEQSRKTPHSSVLYEQSVTFLKDNTILMPADSAIKRIISKEKEERKKTIIRNINQSITEAICDKLDGLYSLEKKESDAEKPTDEEIDESLIFPIHKLKAPPKYPSPNSLLKLIDKIDIIKDTGVLDLNIEWLNNNYQRILARKARKMQSSKIRRMNPAYRYAITVCYLVQLYQDTLDQIVNMYDKIVTRSYNRSEAAVDDYMKERRKLVVESLQSFKQMGTVVLDESVEDESLRDSIYVQIPKDKLEILMGVADEATNKTKITVFNRFTDRYAYLRQFSPRLLDCLVLNATEKKSESVIEAVNILKEMNRDKKKVLPDNAPTGFIPKRLNSYVIDGVTIVSKKAWECALLTVLRDDIKNNNISVVNSKQYEKFDRFFTPDFQWKRKRDAFFERANLPKKVADVPPFLRESLGKAYDAFYKTEKTNDYAKIGKEGWELSIDPPSSMSKKKEAELAELRGFLSSHMRTIKLPDLLLDIDNDLNLSRHFIPKITIQGEQKKQEVCTAWAGVLSEALGVGAYTMASLIGISYNKIRSSIDWRLTESALRGAMSDVVNRMIRLGVTQNWGDGHILVSDSQRFPLKRRILQQTFSTKIRDFALEFYSFISDNYAIPYSLPIEATDRDAPYLLDGHLYNESDLSPTEHYTDHAGYTDINFTAFAMNGIQYKPRFRDIGKLKIYKMDESRDYC